MKMKKKELKKNIHNFLFTSTFFLHATMTMQMKRRNAFFMLKGTANCFFQLRKSTALKKNWK